MPNSVTTAAATPAASKPAPADALPVWDLNDLYPGMTSPELREDIERAQREAAAFRGRYEGKLAALDGAALAEALSQYEAMQERLGRIMSYAQLIYAQNMTDPAHAKFYQTMQERTTDISVATLFFTLELNRIEDARLEAQYAAPALAHYRPWIDQVRAFRPHQLADDMERLLHEKNVTGHAAWSRAFDETNADLRFHIGGETLTGDQALNLLTDRDPAKRKEAALEIGRVYGENRRSFALVTNTLAKDKEIEDRWRGFARADSSRNLSNQVEDEVVDALADAVRGSYEHLSHRYYKLKAQWFGVEQLDYWDRNAPLPDDAERASGWPEATEIVLEAYGSFSKDLAAVGERFFGGGWIDVPPRPGKAPGAFAHPTVPSAHPYLLLNWHGKTRDVMTLAHELGHGVHQILAAGQGPLMADTPLTLAETASVFGEMLTFQSLLARETDPKKRRALLAGKVEDMLNTVVRQIAFYEFEKRVHIERREGELMPERIGEHWMDVQTESLGPAIRFDEGYRWFWCYIPHFIHTPFYVYAYAFGDCLVNSLYAVYRQSDAGFAEKYLDMLRAGGSKRHKELLAPFGLDASDPAFWRRGLSLIGEMIDELERL
ncbi:MAG: M3 family oligoendopeptidase [Dongiaceae bacterium]